jgi:hypothetical protein
MFLGIAAIMRQLKENCFQTVQFSLIHLTPKTVFAPYKAIAELILYLIDYPDNNSTGLPLSSSATHFECNKQEGIDGPSLFLYLLIHLFFVCVWKCS